MRPDGKRVKASNPMYEVVPYIMPRRYDAQNFANIQIDEDAIRAYIRKKREEGIAMDHMTVMIAAYLRICAKYPALNRFVVNRRIYQRNHFCVSFVMLKANADGGKNETVVKVYLDFDDDIFTVGEKIRKVVQNNVANESSNNTDKFVSFLLSLPLLPRTVVGLARFLDQHGLLPRSIIDLSPFHTSMFITNLASLNTTYIYHHLYDFGTTSVFISMGKVLRDYRNNHDERHVLPLGIVMDERIATGYEFSRMMVDIKRLLKNPELLEPKAADKEVVLA